jgi:heterotetrameric sarcosine oxidase beta subunit
MTRSVIPGTAELRNYEVAIIGGGLHGLSLAYNLAKAGRTNVGVLERSYLGAGASGRNLTLLRCSWQQRAWAELAWYSRQIWEQISVELDYNVMFTQRGSYLCMSGERRVELAHAAVAMQNGIGIPTRFVDVAELSEAVPALDTTGMLGAVYDPTAGISRHDALVWAYANNAARLGVAVHTETPVIDLRVSGERIVEILTTRGSISAEIVVNCAGSASAEVAKMAGIELPTRSFPLEMAVTEPYRPYLHPLVSMIEDQAYIIQTSRGEFVFGAEPSGQHADPSLATSYPALRQTAAMIARRFPSLRGVKVLRAWAGLIDMTPDGAGLIGEVDERPGFFLDCGWGGEGYMVCVGTGRLGAEYLNTGTLDPRLARFRYDRFETGETLSDGMLVVDAAGEMRV